MLNLYQKPRLFLFFTLILSACTVKDPVKNEFMLNQYSAPRASSHHRLPSIFVSVPEAVSELQSAHMLYRRSPLEVKAFAHNAWETPPADMIYSLIIQSLQKSHAFRVVNSGTYSSSSPYRLDTQLLELIQDFTTKPSRLRIKLKAMISETNENKTLSSKIFSYSLPCPYDGPYGGVVAANRATSMLTEALTAYTIREVRHQQAVGKSVVPDF